MPQPEYELIKSRQRPGRAPREVVDVVDWKKERKQKMAEFFCVCVSPQDPTEIPPGSYGDSLGDSGDVLEPNDMSGAS